MTQTLKNKSFFRRITLVTVVAVYFLIFVGGIVRSTGSGMGCPDWPKCFGNWVPPTDVSQLPENYKEIYSQKRMNKNEKLAGYLEGLGFSSLAFEIRNDKLIHAETDFNKTKTWIEYINRVVGVIIGFLIILTLYASRVYIGKNNRIFILSLITFLLVVFQGWIGSIVVSTNLLPWMVSVHMLLALVIIGLLIQIWFESGAKILGNKVGFSLKTINVVLVLCIFTLVLQIILGAQVREEIDVIAQSLNFKNRETWIDHTGFTFYVHRSFSILILLLHVSFVYILVKYGSDNKYVLNLSKILLVLVISEIATGVTMAYFNIPPAIQPVHLLLATIIFGLQFYLLLMFNFSTDRVIIVQNEVEELKFIKV